MLSREEILKGLYEHTIPGHAAQVKELTQAGIDLGLDPKEMLYGVNGMGLIPALREVGARFERGEFFVPEMLIAARAMQGAMTLLRPLLAKQGTKPIGTVVMLTVKGDMHDIGKNLCDMMLEGAGFRVIDLGVNVPPEKLVAAVQEHNPQLVGFSAFLTTTMPMFKVNLQALAQASLRDKVKVMVGGAPVTEEYARKVGADGYAPDASSTVRKAKELLGISEESNEGNKALADAVAILDETMRKVGEVEAADKNP
jgi:5-methyltetrahydrofolate--homocysteine methyltransferase